MDQEFIASNPRPFVPQSPPYVQPLQATVFNPEFPGGTDLPLIEEFDWGYMPLSLADLCLAHKDLQADGVLYNTQLHADVQAHEANRLAYVKDLTTLELQIPQIEREIVAKKYDLKMAERSVALLQADVDKQKKTIIKTEKILEKTHENIGQLTSSRNVQITKEKTIVATHVM
jgi:hypothetical protein